MQGDTRPLAKRERQRLIESVIARKRIGSQLDLLAALAATGCRVTQATVSRDIRELGLHKARDPLGRPRYVRSEAVRGTDPAETLVAILAQFGRRATAAQNIVVLQSELGSAPAIARALDEVGHPEVVGTLAGDDTVLVVTQTNAKAASLARELGAAIG